MHRLCTKTEQIQFRAPGHKTHIRKEVKHCTDHEDAEHHVVVVDEEDELFAALRKLGGHAQDEVLHLGLQLREEPRHRLLRVGGADADHRRRELRVPTRDLRKENPREWATGQDCRTDPCTAGVQKLDKFGCKITISHSNVRDGRQGGSVLGDEHVTLT